MKVTSSSQNNTFLRLKPNTFTSICSVIADEANDDMGNYTAQIEFSVLEAIRFCERDHYWFNETRDMIFQTIDKQPVYQASTVPVLKNIIRITDAFCYDGAGVNRKLVRIDPADKDSVPSYGIPASYSYLDKTIRLFPIPSGGPYQIRLIVSPLRLKSIENPNELYPWFEEACDMIKARAKYLLYKNYIKDADLAAEANNDFIEQRNVLRAETSKRLATGRIKATRSY
ncbi:MAG: hypothetical protein JSC085_000994 [Candidatus Tokpelaia sp. JSC085]|nr:MAG: hypothetical protein JSC085_000994 [Candidatus Tokpelaia sp. JSC085]